MTPTTPPISRATLLARIQRELEDRRAQADAVRARLPEAAAALRSPGATRVILFGSFAWGREHAGSDVDLAVVGVAPGDLGVAMADASRAVGRVVEIFELDTLLADFRARVEREGVDLA